MTIASIIAAVLRDPEVRTALREAIAVQPDEWLDRHAAAAYAGTTPRVIDGARRRNELPAGHVGRSARYRRSDLDAWLASRRPIPANDTNDTNDTTNETSDEAAMRRSREAHRERLARRRPR